MQRFGDIPYQLDEAIHHETFSGLLQMSRNALHARALVRVRWRGGRRTAADLLRHRGLESGRVTPPAPREPRDLSRLAPPTEYAPAGLDLHAALLIY